MADSGRQNLLTDMRPCTVVIGQPDQLPVLEKFARTNESSELIALADTEPLRALEVITTRRPEVITVDRLFAATPRGSALINRVKSDPSLSHAEIRVVAPGDPLPPPVSEPAAPAAPAITSASARSPAAPTTTPPLDQRGTRRARRYVIAGQRDVLVDGLQATLIDLSVIGIQLVSLNVLRPNQRVRVVIPDEQGAIRCPAVVAWASFEIFPKVGPRYRAGLEFLNADAVAIDAYCSRHATRDSSGT